MVLIILAIYFIIIILIGIFSHFRIKTPADYYVAGNKGGLFTISGSLLATILGGSAIMGTVELAQSLGWPALWFLISASLGLFLLVPLSKKIKQRGQYTLPELLGSFYGPAAQKASSIIIPIAWLGIIAAQIIAAAKILRGLDIFSYELSAVIAAIVFITYTVIGGQKSIIKTDVFQSVIIIAGIVLLVILILINKPQLAFTNLTVSSLFSSSFTVVDLIILFLTYSVTFLVGPDIYSRIFCARSETTAKRSILTVAIILLPFALILTFLGVFASDMAVGQTNPLITIGKLYLPEWAFAVFIASLLSAVMSSADTTLLTASMIVSELTTGNLESAKAFKATKMYVILIGSVSLIIALLYTSIIQSLLMALAFYSGAFIIPALTGLTNIKINTKNVTAAMYIGGSVALGGKIYANFIDLTIGNIIIIIAFILNFIVLKPSVFKGFSKIFKNE